MILAAQLCSEFKEFFENNAVLYFVSFYDYYQPEAYVPSKDVYIEKDSSVNDEIDKLRHSATSAIAERRDVIIVASVSCIYSLGDPEEYKSMVVSIRRGMEKSRDRLIADLVGIQYERNDINFVRNKFRVRGDVVEIFPANSTDTAIRVEFFGDEIDRITEINVVTGEVLCSLAHAAIFPASHYIVSRDKMHDAIEEIKQELDERIKYFKDNDMLIEAQRIAQRTLPFGLVADHDQFVGRTLRVDALFAQRAERLAAETRRCDGKHDGQFYYSFHRFYTFLCEERADAGAGDRPVQTEIRSLQRWCKSCTASDAIRTTGRAAASARGLPPLQR